MDEKSLDLNRLTMDDIDFSHLPEITAELDRVEKECKEKHGDNWWEHYLRATDPYYDVDLDERTINRSIYEGHEPCITGLDVVQIQTLYYAKMKRLFGPFYKRYVNHKRGDPKINKALIKDALKSGKWKELPECLQGEYHKLAGE